MTVSVPEKTLEHWVSTYLTYRYRAQAGLWWPAFGEDVAIAHLPGWPGKIVNLELKTSTFDPTNPSRHSVKIDVGQLCAYCQLRPSLQPFYVFPWTDWVGELPDAARGAGLDPSDIAFSRIDRHHPGWWFANWMRVFTAAEVAQSIGHPNHSPACGSTSTLQLVRYDIMAGAAAPTVTWTGTGVVPLPWREFWTELQECGRDGWPQVLILPRPAVAGRQRLTRAEVGRAFGDWRNEMIIQAADGTSSRGGPDAVSMDVFEPDGDGGFRFLSALDELEDTVGTAPDLPESHRIAVHLDAALMRF